MYSLNKICEHNKQIVHPPPNAAGVHHFINKIFYKELLVSFHSKILYRGQKTYAPHTHIIFQLLVNRAMPYQLILLDIRNLQAGLIRTYHTMQGQNDRGHLN